MLDALRQSLYSLASGLQAYAKRVETSVVNLSNMHSLPSKPNEDPYTRQMVTFKNEFEKATGVSKIKIGVIKDQKTPYKQELIPGHPAANANGYVKAPNVDFFKEHAEFQEGSRVYGDLSAAFRMVAELNRLTIQMIPA